MDRITVMSWLEGLTDPDWSHFHSDSEVQNIASEALSLLKEQEDLGTELTNAMELIHKKNERIKKLEEQIETLTRWRANAGAFD
jgi:peptidoglycan hydrolase CwlO-like protein